MLMQPRLLLSLLATLAGVALVCYGTLRRGVTVLEWKEREISVLVPSLAGFAEPESDMADGKALPDASDDVNPFESSPVEKAGGASDAEEENPFAPKTSPGRLPNAPGPSPQPDTPPPGLATKVVIETYFEALVLSEFAVVRDVSVGGLTRLENGELKRTYSGQPPALCPT